jgi:GT2 family glycosyltransferase
LVSDFKHDRITDVDILNGWFWMIRREALDQVGLLDERFFMYGEDLDWCLRFQGAGWQLVFYPEAKAIHYGGASSSAAPVRFYVEQQRANFQYWRKHHGLLSQSAYGGIILLHNLLRLVGYLVVYPVSSSHKSDIGAKVRRSWALLGWMIGGRRVV